MVVVVLVRNTELGHLKSYCGLTHSISHALLQTLSKFFVVTGVLEGKAPLNDTFGLFLVQCVIILTICRILGLAGSYLKLPKVIFEIVGGVLLGPSAIGRNKAYMDAIFPKASLPLLNVVAQLGLVLYLFVVGMELDPKLIVSHGKKAGAIAFLGMAVPFALGVAISQIMFDTLQANDPKYSHVPYVSFYVFIGTAMSITAFPVLARILKEGALIYTKPGAMAMGAAALNDAAAWCLLILAISIANAGQMSLAGLVFVCVVAFGVGLVFIVRPLFWRLVAWVEGKHSVALNNSLFCLTLIFVFLAAWTTELLGVHAIFGSFLFGLIVPRESHLFTECNDKIEELVLTLTLPLYFALSGLQTDVTTISSAAEGGMVVLVCFIATIGKYVGAGGAAYMGGTSIRESFVIAFLMNTRGLVELIVLNLGMQAGVLSIRTFSVMVVMCLFTTFITGPMVEWIYPPHMRSLETDEMNEETMELVGKKEQDIEHGGATHVLEEARMDMLAKDVRLTVLVDRIEHLQGMMEVISCFIPCTRNSSLRVMAIKAYEPSLTSKDEFIGLNQDGRLVHVQAESTSYHENYARFVSANMAGKIEPQELLPLSMFLKAVGGEVEAYRIRGDPAEFPREIGSLTSRSGGTLVLFPWRPSQYVERLFWRTLKASPAPIALVAHLNISLTSTFADEQAATTVANGRHRADSGDDSQPTRSRGVSISGDEPPPPRGRGYSQSVEIKKSYTPAKLLTRTPSMLEMVRGRAMSRESDGGLHQIKSVLAIITGAPPDVTIFPLVLRYAERALVEVKVLVTSDRRTFPSSVKEALTSFQRIAKDFPNIAIEHLITPAADVQALIDQCSEPPAEGGIYDMIVVGYGERTANTTNATNTEEIASPRARAATLSENIMNIVPDSVEWRRQLGLPETIANSPLAHPELGPVGCAVEAGGLATYLVVMHETERGLSRKLTKENLFADEATGGSTRRASGDFLATSLKTQLAPPASSYTTSADSSIPSSIPTSLSNVTSSPGIMKKPIFSIPEAPEISGDDVDLDDDNDEDEKGDDVGRGGGGGSGSGGGGGGVVTPPRLRPHTAPTATVTVTVTAAAAALAPAPASASASATEGPNAVSGGDDNATRRPRAESNS